MWVYLGYGIFRPPVTLKELLRGKGPTVKGFLYKQSIHLQQQICEEWGARADERAA